MSKHWHSKSSLNFSKEPLLKALQGLLLHLLPLICWLRKYALTNQMCFLLSFLINNLKSESWSLSRKKWLSTQTFELIEHFYLDSKLWWPIATWTSTKSIDARFVRSGRIKYIFLINNKAYVNNEFSRPR